MKTYAGNEMVSRGYYLDPSTFAFASVEKDGGRLPGGAEKKWMRVPVSLVIAAAPVLGGLLVVTLPFIGIGLTAVALGRVLKGGARAGAREIAATVAPPWVLGEAHLTGKPSEEGAGEGSAEKDARIEGLEEEIAAKRGEGEKR